MPDGSTAFWESLSTSGQLPVNPAYDATKDDGTGKYRAITYDRDCTATCEHPDDLDRQRIRNLLLRHMPISYAGEASDLTKTLRAADISVKLPDDRDQRHISE